MTSSLPALPVIRSLGGCGGTLLSRLFGALPSAIVLSETNPRSANLFGGHLNPLRQLRQWRPELLEHATEFDDGEIGEPGLFGEMLAAIARATDARGLRLIVRDFNYADFIGVPFVWPHAAMRASSLDAALGGRFSPRSLLLVRRPAAQLVSLRTHAALRRTLSAAAFVAGSRAFLDHHAGVPAFRYEDLVERPEPTFIAMCDALDLPFSPQALTGFRDVTTVTGSTARLADEDIAEAPRTAEVTAAERELASTSGYDRLLDELGYDE